MFAAFVGYGKAGAGASAQSSAPSQSANPANSICVDSKESLELAVAQFQFLAGSSGTIHRRKKPKSNA